MAELSRRFQMKPLAASPGADISAFVRKPNMAVHALELNIQVKLEILDASDLLIERLSGFSMILSCSLAQLYPWTQSVSALFCMMLRCH